MGVMAKGCSVFLKAPASLEPHTWILLGGEESYLSTAPADWAIVLSLDLSSDILIICCN